MDGWMFNDQNVLKAPHSIHEHHIILLIRLFLFLLVATKFSSLFFLLIIHKESSECMMRNKFYSSGVYAYRVQKMISHTDVMIKLESQKKKSVE